MRASDFVGVGRGIQGVSRLADARPAPPKFATNFIPPAGRGLHPVLFPLRPPHVSSLHPPTAAPVRLLMSRAAVLVGVAILLAMVVAAIAEWTARVCSRLRALRRASVLRTLNADEDAALAPLRAMTGIVHDDQVRLLRGAFIGGAYRPRHPFNDGMLGGIPVLFPSAARDHMAAWNEAEVVLADRWAVIVRLNGVQIATRSRSRRVRH